MRKLTFLWIIVIIVLIIALSIIGINISKKTADYKALESDIVDAMKVYYGQDTNLKKLPKEKETVLIRIEELISFGIDIKTDINNDKCNGFGIVKSNGVSFNYKAYIKCNKYTTSNYNKFATEK